VTASLVRTRTLSATASGVATVSGAIVTTAPPPPTAQQLGGLAGLHHHLTRPRLPLRPPRARTRTLTASVYATATVAATLTVERAPVARLPDAPRSAPRPHVATVIDPREVTYEDVRELVGLGLI